MGASGFRFISENLKIQIKKIIIINDLVKLLKKYFHNYSLWLVHIMN